MQPKYEIPYRKICLFGETDDIVLFNKIDYKVSISVGFITNKIHPVNCVSCIGARPNIIREDFLEADGPRSIQADNRPSLRNAAKQKFSNFGTITLYVGIDNCTARVVFGVVHSLVVPVLLTISFIYRFLKEIFPLNES